MSIELKNGSTLSSPDNDDKLALCKLLVDIAKDLGHYPDFKELCAHRKCPRNQNIYAIAFGSLPKACAEAKVYVNEKDPDYLKVNSKEQIISRLVELSYAYHNNNHQWIDENEIKKDPILVLQVCMKEFGNIKNLKEAVREAIWNEKHPEKRNKTNNVYFEPRKQVNNNNAYVEPRKGPTILGNINDKPKVEVKPEPKVEPKVEVKPEPKVEVKHQEEVKSVEKQDQSLKNLESEYETDNSEEEYYLYEDDTDNLTETYTDEDTTEETSDNSTEDKVETKVEINPETQNEEPKTTDSDKNEKSEPEPIVKTNDQPSTESAFKDVFEGINKTDNYEEVFIKVCQRLGHLLTQTEIKQICKEHLYPFTSWEKANKVLGHWSTWKTKYNIPYKTERLEQSAIEILSKSAKEDKPEVESTSESKVVEETKVEEPIIETKVPEDTASDTLENQNDGQVNQNDGQVNQNDEQVDQNDEKVEENDKKVVENAEKVVPEVKIETPEVKNVIETTKNDTKTEENVTPSVTETKEITQMIPVRNTGDQVETISYPVTIILPKNVKGSVTITLNF